MSWRLYHELMRGKVLVVVAVRLTACEGSQAVSATATSNVTSSVAVTAIPSLTPAPAPTPTQLPTRTPTPTLNPTAANDLAQVRELSSAAAAEQGLVRVQCADLAVPSVCQYIVNQTAQYAQGIPPAIQGFVDNYNLSADLTSAINNLQVDLSSLSHAISAELSGIQALSSSEVLSASSQVESDAFAIAGAAQGVQNSLT